MRGSIAVLAVLAWGTVGCLAEGVCTPADSTYACCLKQHVGHPAACSAVDAETSLSMTGVAVGTLTAAATLSSGDPLKAKTLFDLKFPCLRDTQPEWARHKETLFHVEPIRITPWQAYR